MHDYLRPVLAAYPMIMQPSEIQSLGNAGGYSGARFWRLKTYDGVLCLRRWPAEHPDRRQLQWIHQALGHARGKGLSWIASPMHNRRGETIVERSRWLWEITRWLPGANA